MTAGHFIFIPSILMVGGGRDGFSTRAARTRTRRSFDDEKSARHGSLRLHKV